MIKNDNVAYAERIPFNFKDLISNYWEWIKYNTFIKSKHKRLIKESSEMKLKVDYLKGLIDEYNKLEKENIGVLKNYININESKNLYFTGKEVKLSWMDKLKSKLPFFNFDGYIIYGNKALDFKILKVKNLKNLYKLENKEAYNMVSKIGTMYGKPVFLIVYPHAITLNVNDDGSLFWDSESYYNYVDYATKGNLTHAPDSFNMGDFIKKNIFWIIIIIIILFIAFTPEGKKVLADLFGNVNPATEPVRVIKNVG